VWGDIPAKGWRIHPRPEAVAFCCRGKSGEMENSWLELISCRYSGILGVLKNAP